MATNTKKVKGLQIPFKEFMPGQLIISSQFNDDMKDIEDKVNEIIEEHNVMSEEIDTHTDNTENPHQVNAHQVGTYDSGEIDEFVNDLRNGEFNDNVIENNVLADDCIDTRNYRDASITSSKVEPSFGSQLDISENIEIRTRYTKQETDELIKTKVGDGTYTKEELDTKFEEVQAGVIIDSTIGLEKLKPNVGNELDISRNVNIRNKYTKDEVDYLIKTNALPRDWGSILEADIDESFQSKDTGVIPAADYMIADMFVSPTSTALEFDIKEVADSRNGYDSLNDRLNASDTKISSLELSVNDFKSEVEAAFLNTLEKVDTLEEISGSLDTQIKGINKQIFDNTNEVDSKIKKINTQLKQVDTSINNANTQISALTEKDANHEINLNKLGSRIDTTSSQLQQVKSDVETLKTKPSVPVEIVQQVNKNTEDNKRQDIMLSGLFNENADGRLSTEESGNDIKLIGSKQGLVEVEKIVGNTLVNRVSEPMRELTLNGDIDAQGTFVTTTEGTDKGLVDVACEGNTLVNLLPNRELKINCSFDWDCYLAIGRPNETLNINFGNAIQDVKPNTEYTLIYNVVKRPTNSYYYINNPNINTVFNSEVRVFEDSPLGINKIKLTTVSDLTGRNIVLRQQNSTSRGEIHIKDYILLEGDWTNKEIPSYFTGMKSVGECADGNHKIEILSSNKNILSPIKNKKHPFYIKKGTKLILTPKNNETSLGGNVKLYDISGNVQWMGINAGETSSLYRVTNNDIFYIENSLTGDVEHQLEISTTPTSHVPHASNKKEILLNEPLRGLPNGVKDKLVKIDGKWFIERNCGGYIINGTENWSIRSTHTNTITFNCSNLPLNSSTKFQDSHLLMKCNILECRNYDGHDREYIMLRMNGDGFVMGINRDKLSSLDVNGLNKWISENRVEIVYQLNKPIYEPLEVSPELVCYNEVTHISNNSIIPCNMKVKNTGFSCRALTSGGTYTVVHNGGEGITSKVDTTDNMVRLRGKGKKVSDVMVLDGEVSKTYGSFEGMQSTFEDKLVTQEMVDDGLEKAENLGKYRVGVKVRNKNLANKLINYRTHGGDKYTTKVVKAENGDMQGYLVEIKPNTPYTFTKDRADTRFRAFFFVNNPIENPDEISIGGGYSDNFAILNLTSPPNARYCFLYATYNYTTSPFKWCQIEEGTKITSYEPSKEYNASILLSSPPLKGDEIVWKEDGLYHYHKMGKVILNGSDDENWLDGWNEYYKVNGYSIFHTNIENKLTADGLCDKFIGDSLSNSNRKECALFKDGGNKAFGIQIANTKLRTQNIIGFKEWLRNNPTTVVYELAEPYFEKISDNKFMTEIPNNATLSIDSIIPCQSVKVSYTGNVPSVYGLEETGITNTNDIAATQTAVDFLLMSSMGEVMMSFKNNTKGGNNMGAYFASRIMKKALKYEDVIRKYPEFKEDIDFILRSEGYGDLIVEVQ